MSEPREETPNPADRPEADEGAEQSIEEQSSGDEQRERRDYKGQDLEGGMPLPEYDIYRDVPGERVGG